MAWKNFALLFKAIYEQAASILNQNGIVAFMQLRDDGL